MYNFLTLSTLASAIAALPARPSDEFGLTTRQEVNGSCATGVHVMAVSGDGANNIGGYGLIITLVDGILNAIPGSTKVTIDYEKGNDNGVVKVSSGVSNLKRYWTEYRAACPNTLTVLAGYSAGGIISMNTICGADTPFGDTPPIDSSFNDNLIATIIYGDLTYLPNLPYDKGTCNGKGRFPRTDPDSCAPFSDHINSYCDLGDPQCCVGGFDPDVHFQYPNRYDNASIAYVKQRYQEETALLNRVLGPVLPPVGGVVDKLVDGLIG